MINNKGVSQRRKNKTNQLLHFWADKGFVYLKRVLILSFLISSHPTSFTYCNVVVYILAGWDKN